MSEFDFNNDYSRTKKDESAPIFRHLGKIVVGLICFAVFLYILYEMLNSSGSIIHSANDFKYVVISETKKTISIVSMNSNDRNISIPETKDGYTIIAISEKVFNRDWEFGTVHVPNTVRYIAPQSGKVSFIINETNPYITITDGILFNKDKTELITCLSYDYEVGKRRVNEGFTIPDTVIKINDSFKNCSGFNDIKVDENNPCFTAENGGLYNKDKTILIKGFGKNIIIANSVRRIESYALKNCDISTIEMPFGVEKIGSSAFENCSYLGAIIIPDSVTSIEENAFNGCFRLRSVEMSHNISEIKRCVFKECTNLVYVSIPAGINEISESAFSGCFGLADVSIDPANKRYAFSDGLLWDLTESRIICATKTKLEISIPYGVTVLRSGVFDGGRNGVSYLIDDIPFFRLIQKVNLPSSVKTIEGDSFSCCESLKAVTIPASVTEIGKGMFLKSPNVRYTDGGFRIVDHDLTFTLYVESGSYAESYAKDNGVKYEIYQKVS